MKKIRGPKQVFLSDTITTDTHIASYNGAMQDILHIFDKLRALGMSLNQLVVRSSVKNLAASGQISTNDGFMASS